MIFSVLSDRSENENITTVIVVVMIIMILRGNYYYYYYYYKLMPMALIISFISIKNETSILTSAGFGA